MVLRNVVILIFFQWRVLAKGLRLPAFNREKTNFIAGSCHPLWPIPVFVQNLVTVQYRKRSVVLPLSRSSQFQIVMYQWLTALLLTLKFPPSYFGAIQNVMTLNWKILFDVHSRYISDIMLHILFYCGFILSPCVRFLAQCITVMSSLNYSF